MILQWEEFTPVLFSPERKAHRLEVFGVSFQIGLYDEEYKLTIFTADDDILNEVFPSFEEAELAAIQQLYKMCRELNDILTTPVASKTESQDDKQSTVRVAGKPFICECGCNVFTKINMCTYNRYVCNSCRAGWVGE